MAKINVSRLRASLNETQTEFAERFGVNQSTVSRWEDGEEPSGPAMVILNNLERDRLARMKKTEMRAAG
jgi:DNA-binding transcriptional regulator YiaG